MYNIDYEKADPLEIMQKLKANKDKDRIDKILKMKIFEVKDWKLIIPSFKCNNTKQVWHENKQFKSWFPFTHQVFWFELIETKDLDFAISEVNRILKWEKQYLFPNGTMVQLES